MKKQIRSFDPEEVREELLKYLYDKYKNSRSTKKQSATVGEIKKALKVKGYKESDIVSAITFLKDRGWIKEEKEKTKFFIKGKLTESEKTKYRISDIAIVHFEGPSKFVSSERFSGINIMNIQGVTVIGNNNIVRNEFIDLFRELEKLGDIIRSNSKLSDKEKVDLQSDIETIKTQLGKTEPNKNIIKAAFETIKDKLKDISEFIEPILKIASLIKILKIFT
jgi:hypothetical protein